MSDEPYRTAEPVTTGEDLYGVSVKELEARIGALETEIARTRAELDKKRRERSEADILFGGSN